ncbi:MAG: type II toxin-antitoxin system PemK/MazF family toxin [Paludibacter sp.]|nr:type II toxin-antitoxin system PemK/MazF family toxin [Paludibacter sp.]
MPYNLGDIVIDKFPFTDLTGYKQRPAIIVSNQIVNRSGDFIVVMLTTQSISGSFGTMISNSDVNIDFKPPHSSMSVYCKKIAVLDKSVIIKKISEINNNTKLTEIITLIKSVF